MSRKGSRGVTPAWFFCILFFHAKKSMALQALTERETCETLSDGFAANSPKGGAEKPKYYHG